MLQNPKLSGREQLKEMTTGVQGDYRNFKQNLAEKETFVISEDSQSQPLFSKHHLRVAKFLELTTRALSEQKCGDETEIFPERQSLLYNFSPLPQLEDFLRNAMVI